MDEQPRTESETDEPTPAGEPEPSAAPNDPADVAPFAAAQEPSTPADPVPDASDALADLRIHPWQVIAPVASGPAPITVPLVEPLAAVEPVAYREFDAQDAQEAEDDVVEREERAASPALPAEVSPAPEAALAPDSIPLAEASGGRDDAAAPDSAPVATVETVETVELAPVALVAAMGAVAPELHGGAGALPLFTAATVPPGPPSWRDDQQPRDLPTIPVDPSAETVPLSSRTDEVAAVARAYPGYPGFRGSPQAAGQPARFSALRRPLPRDAVARILTAACGTIVLAAVLGIVLTQGEWATGLAAAGIAALLVAGAYLVGTVVRAIAGAGKGSTLRLGLLAVVIFGLLGEAGVYFNGSLHQVQARVLVSIGDYGGAVREYRLAGYLPPNSDLAGAYLGWGNALLRQHDYADAAANFQVVVEEYTSTTAAHQATAGLLAAYDGWMTAGSPTIPFPTMLGDLATVGQSPACDSACAATVSGLTARAHLEYGRALNGSGDSALAIAQFETVTGQYASSPYAAVAHANAAITYYLIGQNQFYGTTCSDAVPTYQRLASAYGDTTEGATAKAALAAPVQVIGSLTGYPKNPAPVVYLSKTIRSDTYFSDDYSATLDANGNFTFKNVPPGSYNLSAAIPNGSGVYWVDPATHNPYSITVGPLCTVKLQPYPYS